MSTLTKDQVKTFRADYYVDGQPETLIAHVRHDDRCGNGDNTFSITGDIYMPDRQPGEPTIKHKDGARLWLNGGGCVHDTISEHLPELAKYIKWHLCSTDGPLHYLANTIHLAGDRDCWGLGKGEFQQSTTKDGIPKWCIELKDEHGNPVLSELIRASKVRPLPVTLQWEPYGRKGEGKERELESARRSAIWPEATDEELTAPDLEEKLKARLPALMVEFRKAVEELGFTY